jgi:hypothetical protein
MGSWDYIRGVVVGPDTEYQSSMLSSAAPDFTNRNQSAMVALG